MLQVPRPQLGRSCFSGLAGPGTEQRRGGLHLGSAREERRGGMAVGDL